MAFKPVRRVRERRYPTTVQAELAERLEALATLPPSPPTPYLTVSLDWRPSGSDPEYRGAIQRFEQDARQCQEEHWPRGEVFDSLGEDIERIQDLLSNRIDPATRGVFVVANSGQGVFQTISLGLPLQTRVVSGPIPALLPVARLDEDNPSYAVLLADQQNAYLSIIAQGHRVEELAIASSDYPRKQATGGWSQRRFQQRADERMLALGRQISEEANRYLNERGIDMLILAGDEVITSVLDRTMPDELKQRVVETIRLDIQATTAEILDATRPIAERAESEREVQAVEQVADMIGAGHRAVGGSREVIDALAQGRVTHLLINEDFHEDGWADFTQHRYGAGADQDVTAGTTGPMEAVPIIVQEEMIRLAVQHGADLDVIHTGVPLVREANDAIPDAGEIPRSPAATRLDVFGGVAAILRY